MALVCPAPAAFEKIVERFEADATREAVSTMGRIVFVRFLKEK